MHTNIIEFDEATKQLDTHHIEDIHNQLHPSYYFSTEEYQLLILRFFDIKEDEFQGVSIPYIITKNGFYKYNRDTNHFIIYTTTKTLLHSIELRVKKAERLVKRYIDEIDALEDALYSRKIPAIFLDLWFDLKKDLTRIDRMLERIDSVLCDYLEEHEEDVNFPKDSMENILEHIRRYQRLANLHTVKLDTLYNYYNSLKNDKINNNIYTLTILSGIFLPLNLIVGFFGMNTENLFFTGDPHGTQNVIMILFLMFIVLLIIFPLTKTIHRYFIQKVLNKFHLYNKIINRFKKLTKD